MTRILRSMASRSCKAGLSEFSRIMTSKSLNVWVNNRETDCLARAGLFRVGITTENLGFMALLSNLDFKVCSNCEPKPNVRQNHHREKWSYQRPSQADNGLLITDR